MGRKKAIDLNNPITPPVPQLSGVIAESKTRLAGGPQVEKKTRTRKPSVSDLPMVPVIPVGPSAIRPALASMFELSGGYAAAVTEYPDFKLNADEVKMLADQADDCAKEFIPGVQSRWAKLVTLVVSTVSVFGAKYIKFTIHAQKEFSEKLSKIEEEKKVINPEGPFPVENR